MNCIKIFISAGDNLQRVGESCRSWIVNYIHYKKGGWNYLTIPKLQPWNIWSLGLGQWFHQRLFCACDSLSMLGFKIIHVSKNMLEQFMYDSRVLVWHKSTSDIHTLNQVRVEVLLPCNILVLIRKYFKLKHGEKDARLILIDSNKCVNTLMCTI